MLRVWRVLVFPNVLIESTEVEREELEKKAELIYREWQCRSRKCATWMQ
jgi:hypothetical protein